MMSHRVLRLLPFTLVLLMAGAPMGQASAESRSVVQAATVEQFRATLETLGSQLTYHDFVALVDSLVILDLLVHDDAYPARMLRGALHNRSLAVQGLLVGEQVGLGKAHLHWLLHHIGALVDGKTPAEVVQLAVVREISVLTRVAEGLEQQVAEFQSQLARAEAAPSSTDYTEIERIELRGARYYWKNLGSTDVPWLEFEAANKGDVAIERIGFRVTLVEPTAGGLIASADLQHPFGRALVPGARRFVSLGTEVRLSPLGRQELKSREKFVLRIEILDATTTDGRTLGGRATVDAEAVKREVGQTLQDLAWFQDRLKTLERKRTQIDDG